MEHVCFFVPEDLLGVTRLRVTLLAPACSDEKDVEDEEEEDEDEEEG